MGHRYYHHTPSNSNLAEAGDEPEESAVDAAHADLERRDGHGVARGPAGSLLHFKKSESQSANLRSTNV